jgi:hypothetical protein
MEAVAIRRCFTHILSSPSGKQASQHLQQRAEAAMHELQLHVCRVTISGLLLPLHIDLDVLDSLFTALETAHGGGPAPMVGKPGTPTHHMCLGRHMTRVVADMPDEGACMLRHAMFLATTAVDRLPGVVLTDTPRLVAYRAGGGQAQHAHGAGGEAGDRSVQPGADEQPWARYIYTQRLCDQPTPLRFTLSGGRMGELDWQLHTSEGWLASATGEGRWALRSLADSDHRRDNRMQHGVPALRQDAASLLYEGEYDRRRYPTLESLGAALATTLQAVVKDLWVGRCAVPEGDEGREAQLLAPIWRIMQRRWGGRILNIRGRIQAAAATNTDQALLGDVAVIYAAGADYLKLIDPIKRKTAMGDAGLTEASLSAPLPRLAGHEINVREFGLLLNDLLQCKNLALKDGGLALDEWRQLGGWVALLTGAANHPRKRAEACRC